MAKKIASLSLIAATVAVVVLLTGGTAEGRGRIACSSSDPAGTSHVASSIDHGWHRTWVCDKWTYTAWTKHSHGQKWAGLAWQSGNFLCSDFESGSVSASCSANATSTSISSWHDTGSAGGCDRYPDAHGVCLHEMEAVP